ncbi:hypothetical protein N9N67_00915 [Bacteriovoracaceae bacterium]|nr:hypothetical protein [Bacteriovoracaceae bacterium]
MIKGCPNLKCIKIESNIQKDGNYFRKNDSRKVQRYRCRDCGKRFSKSTGELEYRQKKRRVNFFLFKLLALGMSMRRCALNLNIHQITVKRKLIYLAKKARMHHDEYLKKIRGLNRIQFDDLITIEHTKLKPLTVSCAVDSNSRAILGAHVASIPAFGHLAKISKKKYGRRENNHKNALEDLFNQIKASLDPQVEIRSDEHKLYPFFVNKHLPHAKHLRFKGGRSCVTGQGELKRKRRDPLFSINHSYAMLRANINRLFRRSWCTTKDPVMLKNHIDLFIHYHNTILI